MYRCTCNSAVLRNKVFHFQNKNSKGNIYHRNKTKLAVTNTWNNFLRSVLINLFTQFLWLWNLLYSLPPKKTQQHRCTLVIQSKLMNIFDLLWVRKDEPEVNLNEIKVHSAIYSLQRSHAIISGKRCHFILTIPLVGKGLFPEKLGKGFPKHLPSVYSLPYLSSEWNTLFMIEVAKIDIVFLTKMAEKAHPLGPHMPI